MLEEFETVGQKHPWHSVQKERTAWDLGPKVSARRQKSTALHTYSEPWALRFPLLSCLTRAHGMPGPAGTARLGAPSRRRTFPCAVSASPTHFGRRVSRRLFGPAHSPAPRLVHPQTRKRQTLHWLPSVWHYLCSRGQLVERFACAIEHERRRNAAANGAVYAP